ncbi:MAG: glycosyltransferase family 4 protein, partial [Planctomycetes bacterium]|nr:glycosyltransferase family 4 protein [Planctomycetota bacterium]
ANLMFFKELRLRSAVAFRRWMEAGKADAWVCVVPPSGYGAWQVGGSKIPYLYMANSPWAQEWLSAYRQSHGREAKGIKRLLGVWPRRRIERKLVHGASAWMALSPTQLAWMAAEHGRCAGVEKYLIEGGVDCNEVRSMSQDERQAARASLAEQYGLHLNTPWLICSRRLVPRTGVNVLLQALASIPDTQLIVTGDGPERAALEALARTLGVEQRVKFTGIVPQKDLATLTATADLSLLPTQELEGFGLSAAEAFAAGTPVVATPVGGLVDVVGEFGSEFLSESIGADAIAERISLFLAQATLAKEGFRGSAREYALKRFDWQRHKKSFVAAVEKIATLPRAT